MNINTHRQNLDDAEQLAQITAWQESHSAARGVLIAIAGVLVFWVVILVWVGV